MTSTWASPMAVRIVSPVPSSRCTRMAGSSSSMRWSAWPSLSRSAFDSGSMLTCRVGSGKDGFASSSACARSATSVSPIWVLVSFATAAMSPGPACAMFDWSLPIRPRMLPMRSSSLRVAFQRWSCAFRLPDTTEEGQATDEGIGGGLEHLRHEGPDGSGAIWLPSAVVRPPTSAAGARAWRSWSSARGHRCSSARCRRRPGPRCLARALVQRRLDLGVARPRGTCSSARRTPRPRPRPGPHDAAPRRHAARPGWAPPSASRPRRRWRAAR